MIDTSAEGDTDGPRGILNLPNQSGDCIFTKRRCSATGLKGRGPCSVVLNLVNIKLA
jgi:hypothetical protein